MDVRGMDGKGMRGSGMKTKKDVPQDSLDAYSSDNNSSVLFRSVGCRHNLNIFELSPPGKFSTLFA